MFLLVEKMAGSDPNDDFEAREITRIRQDIIASSLDGDYLPAVEHLKHSAPKVRATVLKVLDNEGKLEKETIETALMDSAFDVRYVLAYLISSNLEIPAMNFLRDDDPSIVEVACWGVGERGEASAEILETLQSITESHEDALCRESAVAALGALGDEKALGSILKAVDDIATVRRRAVLALSPFDGPEVDSAIVKALEDRDWQVRQAAEDISR